MKKMQTKLDEIKTLITKLSKDYPSETNAFMSFINKAEAGKALDVRQKELINVALAIAAQCEWCIALHVEQALKVVRARMKSSNLVLWRSLCTAGLPICI